MLAAGVVSAQGGTAKPPSVTTVPNNTIYANAGPPLPVIAPLDNGFSVSGLVQAVTLTGGALCAGAPGQTTGGTVTINGVVITVPSNTIVQFPANTLTFADSICPNNAAVNPLLPPPPPGSSLAFDGSGGTPTGVAAGAGIQASPVLPSVEMRVDGNIIGGGAAAGVGSTHVAALVYVSQHSANTGSGYIQRIDYTDGSIYVSAGGGAAATRLLINDPIGRYGRPQSNPDVRFSVDTANPTIKSGASGYPMCVPRVAPSGTYAIENDPRCPQKNRPTGNIAAGGIACRNFAAAGLTGFIGNNGFAGPFRIPGADLSTVPTPAGFCPGFVMKALTGMPGAVAAAAISPGNVIPAAGAPVNEPDPREQVPFEVGDFISWQGTLVRQGNVPAPVGAADAVTTGDLIWVHTIDANVGAYTQPRTLPAYVAVGEFTVGVDPQPTGAAVVGIETTARLVLESNTSDVASIVDVYTDDKGFGAPTVRPLALGGTFINPTPGAEWFRWMTPETMTGTLAEQAAAKVPYATSAQPFGGGIESQYVGPQPGRARIRAEKVPPIAPTAACPAGGGSQGCSVTNSPTRYLRVVIRSLCAPAASGSLDANGVVVPSAAGGSVQSLDGTPWRDINGALGAAPLLPGSAPGTTSPADGPGNGKCLERAQFANGLFTGQYMAPVNEFIFPENTLAGNPIVPANTWQMGFMVYGESGVDGNSTAPQVPSPW